MVNDVKKEILEIVDLAIIEKAKQPDADKPVEAKPIKVKKPTLPKKPKEVPIVVEKKEEPIIEPEIKVEVPKPKVERRGRPKGSSDKVNKIRLKPTPKSAKEAFKRDFKDLDLIAIYGVDDFTEELIRYLWTDMNKNFVVTDPIEQRVANLTRSIGNLPYSMYRYDQVRHTGFVEEGMFPVVIVAEEHWEEVSKLPNPNKVLLFCLSHWG